MKGGGGGSGGWGWGVGGEGERGSKEVYIQGRGRWLICAADISEPTVTCLPSLSWADNSFITVIMCRWKFKGPP